MAVPWRASRLRSTTSGADVDDVSRVLPATTWFPRATHAKDVPVYEHLTAIPAQDAAFSLLWLPGSDSWLARCHVLIAGGVLVAASVSVALVRCRRTRGRGRPASLGVRRRSAVTARPPPRRSRIDSPIVRSSGPAYPNHTLLAAIESGPERVRSDGNPERERGRPGR